MKRSRPCASCCRWHHDPITLRQVLGTEGLLAERRGRLQPHARPPHHHAGLPVSARVQGAVLPPPAVAPAQL